MHHSQSVAWARVLALVVGGLGLPWLAVALYYSFAQDPMPIPWDWVPALGWLLDIAVQWIIGLTLLRAFNYRIRDVVVGSGRWLEPDVLLKVFVLLILTGLSLDYLWQLPWFEAFPDKLLALSEPNSQSFSDEEALNIAPTVLTTTLMLTAGPVIEEIFYRGLMLKTFGAVMPIRWAIIFSSLLFGLYHRNDPLAAFFFSAMLSVIYVRTGSLYSCIALHIAYNIQIAVLETLTLIFPQSWYRGFDLFRPTSWWLHASILIVSGALLLDYKRTLSATSSQIFREKDPDANHSDARIDGPSPEI